MLFKQKSFSNNQATLYLVATPIGNLEDITFRAVNILKKVALILAEDTRTATTLLSKYQIKAPLLSYYQYNQKSRLSQILEFLLQGKNLALISDAGTPLISDPGFDLVEKIQKAGFNVVAIPGASAFLTAFVTSNLPAPFIFLSFLSRFRQTLEKQLLKYKYATETLIIYESPHRIKKTLSLIYQIFGNRKISLARELTKKFETIINCDLASIIHETLNHKGEYVLLVQGNPNPYQHLLLLNISEHVLFYVKLGLSQKEALSKVAKDRKTNKKEIYRIYNNIESTSKIKQ